jgi:hypothetical protein
MRFLKWLGRVTLWFVFLPIGLWRSIRHGQRKAIQRAVAEARKAS